jgi:hypothetical protein
MVQRSNPCEESKGVLGYPEGYLAIKRGRQESAVAVGLVRASKSADIPIKLRFDR